MNLDLAYGTAMDDVSKETIIRQLYRHLVLNLADFIDNQGAAKATVLDKVIFVHAEYLDEAIKSDRPVILVTAHYGNWELLPLAIAARFAPLTGIGRPLDSGIMDTILKANREQFDIDMIDKNGAMRAMIATLKRKRMLGLLVDQNTSEKEGILIDFFGKQARHTPSAAILARKFNAIVVPVFISTEDHVNHTITCYPPLPVQHSEDVEADILAHVQSQATITEQVIREKPDEWFWLHKRWKNQFEHLYR